MKTCVIGIFVGITLSAIIFLSGCDAPAHTPDSSGMDTASSTTAQETTKTTDTSEPAETTGNTTPAAVSGTYNGETVTLQCVQTNRRIDNTVTSAFSQGYAAVFCIDAGKEAACFVDEQGNILGDALYRFAYSFDNTGRALVQKADDTWVYIDTAGQETGPGEAPQGEIDTAIYEENGLFGLQDQTGSRLTEPVFSFIQSFTQPQNYAILAQGEHKNVLIDSQGQVVATLPDDCVGCIPLNGSFMACAYRTENGQNAYRLMDTAGRLISEEQYSVIGSFENGLAPVARDGRVGLIDGQGRVVIPPTLPIDDEGAIALRFNEGKFIGTQDGLMTVFSVTHN